MSTIGKILATIVALVVTTFIFGTLNAGHSSEGGAGSIIKLIIVVGLVAGLRAIWKSAPKQDNSSDDLPKLNKEGNV